MKRSFLILGIVLSAMLACQNNQKMAEIRFCADIMPDQPCVGEDTVFIRGTDVWAQLLLKPEFKDTAVFGDFYGWQNGVRVFIERKVHPLDKDEKIVMEALFLNLCGNFEVEFYDTRGNLLAKKRFQII